MGKQRTIKGNLRLTYTLQNFINSKGQKGNTCYMSVEYEDKDDMSGDRFSYQKTREEGQEID